MEHGCPTKHLPNGRGATRHGCGSRRGRKARIQLRHNVVERRSPVVHVPFKTLHRDVHSACEGRAALAVRLADDTGMAEVFFFGRLADPIPPRELKLDYSERLVARVVPEVLDENTPREGREVDRPCSPPV